MQIFIRDASNRRVTVRTIEVQPDDFISYVREAYLDKLGLDDQTPIHFIHNGVRLFDDSILRECGIDKETTIHAMHSLRED